MVPKHIAIILDGNRRFAKRLMLKPWKGHEWGAKKIEKLFEWCQELDIKELTLYVFSVENFNRPKEEFDYLMNIFKKEFSKLLSDERIEKNKVKINFIGRLLMLPEDLQEIMQKVMEKTKNYSEYVVNFAIAYGGREEVIDATRKIAMQVKSGKLDIEKINDEIFAKNLYISSEPDLIIRTSESRLSGFLPWQGSYAEIIFLPDVLWPDFNKEHFISCINEYKIRQRRFGK